MPDLDLFSILRQTDIAPATRQFMGLPPSLSGLERDEMPRPRILVIKHREDGIFLLRYSEQGRFAGDTWHLTVEDAKHQSIHEYGSLVGEWREVPQQAEDPLKLALAELASTKDE